MKKLLLSLMIAAWAVLGPADSHAQNGLTAQQLENLLKQYPAADTNRDGKLSLQEASAYRAQMLSGRDQPNAEGRRRGIQRQFAIDPGWELDQFPDHAVCYRSPDEIKAIYESTITGNQPGVASFEKPNDGALRIVGTGHSFMAPGYKTFPLICEAAGMDQPLCTHLGGGMTGSARYKWEQENGIFSFDGKPKPKLLASIANANWDAMMWGPYYNDRPEFYACWIDFCLKYNPDMKFYLSDAWPQLEQLGKIPSSESFFTPEIFDRLGAEKRESNRELIETLREEYPDKVFVLPTSDAMVLAAKYFLRGELPGIEGIHRVVGKKERSLWKDQLGHLGPGLERLEGYVFYATIYGKSPELIQQKVNFGGNNGFPGPDLDKAFREIAWKAVSGNPMSGVIDKDGDGISDHQRDR